MTAAIRYVAEMGDIHHVDDSAEAGYAVPECCGLDAPAMVPMPDRIEAHCT